MREIITLECTECKNRNYTTTKNKNNTRERLELKKILQALSETYTTSGDKVVLLWREC